MLPDEPYKDLWRKVQDFIDRRLPQSALATVDQIYAKAIAEEDQPNCLKSLVFQFSLQATTSDGSEVLLYAELRSAMTSSTGTMRAILQSMLGEYLWNYYRINRSENKSRSLTDGIAPEDFRTWDPHVYADTARAYYLASLEQAALLNATPIRSYQVTLDIGPGSDAFRPTLYDLLAFRALNFFEDDETDLTIPMDEFQPNERRAFAPTRNFVNTSFRTTDSSSRHWTSIRIYQQLLQFHLQDADPIALVDADLRRLSYIRSIAVSDDADSLYRDALADLAHSLRGDNQAARVLYSLAIYYQEENNLASAMEVCNEAIKRFPHSIGAADCLATREEILRRSISIKGEATTLPNAPFIANLVYRNITTIYMRVIPVNDSLSDEDDYRRNNFGPEALEMLLKESPLHTLTVSLPQPKPADYATHTLATRIPGLATGRYIILASPDSNFPMEKNAIAYTFVTATRLAVTYQHIDNEGITQIHVTDAVTGKPEKGVNVRVWAMGYNHDRQEHERTTLMMSRSNANGLVVFNHRQHEHDRTFGLTLDKGNDHLTVDGSITNEYYEPPTESTQTLLFTDRSIYRPGQTIYFKGISVWQNSQKTTSKALTQRSVTLGFYDVNNQKIIEKTVRTNEYGSFNGSVIAPIGALNGVMTLRTTDGSRSIRVEEYKRPRFEVVFKPVRSVVRLGDRVHISGTATAYAGSVIGTANVAYHVARKCVIPYEDNSWSPIRDSVSPEIAHGTVTTDSLGSFTISFTAIPDRSIPRRDSPVFSYEIVADVTDINGETEVSSTTLRVGYSSLQLNLISPEYIESGSEVAIRVMATTLSGEPIATRGRLLINRLTPPTHPTRMRILAPPDQFTLTRSEFRKTFPLDPYDIDSTNRETWPSDQIVLNRRFTTDTTGVDSAVLGHLAPGIYRVVAEQIELGGDTLRTTKTITVYSRVSTSPISNEPLTVIPVKISGEPGDSAEILVGSGCEDGYLLYQLEERGSIILQQTIALSKNQQLITIPLKEEYRGGLVIHLMLVHDYRLYNKTIAINVPWTNKDLRIETSTFRNKLEPGQAEEWRLTIKGSMGEKVAAEMVATLYDASLDAIHRNPWEQFSWPTYSSQIVDVPMTFGEATGSRWSRDWNNRLRHSYQSYDELNTFRLNTSRWLSSRRLMRLYRSRSGDGLEYGALYESQPYEMDDEAAYNSGSINSLGLSGSAPFFKQNVAARNGPPVDNPDGNGRTDRTSMVPLEMTGIQIRRNLQETAFFMPEVATNANGEIVIRFTIPEALTRWRLMGFAHTPDMKTGSIDTSVVTQKKLMIIPNLPRFFREGDSITFSATINNLSGAPLSGCVVLSILDAHSLEPIDSAFGLIDIERGFEVPKLGGVAVEWRLKVPDAGDGMVLYRIAATAGTFSDGEEGPIPILPNRMLVTETMPLNIRGNQTRSFAMEKLVNSGGSSSTLRNQKLTLEMTSNPAWYAVQALPYLIDFPYECAEQTFSRLYANAIASQIANSNPRIKQVFASWKGTNALVSNLEKNEELKGLLLQETPWVMEGRDETERKQRIALLFDLDRMSRQLAAAASKLEAMQDPSGGWPWFKGMKPNLYISAYIVAGIGHLRELGVEAGSSARMTAMAEKALGYIDNELRSQYDEFKRRPGFMPNADNIGTTEINCLYARSFFTSTNLSRDNKEAFLYWTGQAQKYWTTKGLMVQGMIAIALKRFNDEKTPIAIIASLRERALHSDELGTYWKFDDGWWWYQAPVETQAILIEAFDVVVGDQDEIDEMKIWLLKQKQVQDWKTTKATAEACYALLRRGSEFLANDKIVEVTMGGQRIDPTSGDSVAAEAGTGYFKTSWRPSEITPSMGNISLTKRDAGIAWGAIYWQYFEQLDKITPHASPLSISKGMFVRKNTDRGRVLTALAPDAELHLGDVVVVRVEIRCDRDMEYIHVKDMRGAGLEPVEQLSGYRWQGGLGYYQSIHDASTNFFISWLPKGLWIFEYPLRVSQKGTFSNGISTVQSMYAPEFASHTGGTVLRVR